jgi:conjugal transfer pilus assembly protein TraW
MSLAVRILYFKAVLLAMLLALASSPAGSGEDAFFLDGIGTDQAIQLPDELPAWLKTQPAPLTPGLEAWLKKGPPSFGSQQAAESAPAKLNRPGRWLFVSLSMPEEELKAAVYEASESRAMLVFRGVPKGHDISSIAKALVVLVGSVQPIPAAVIDPTLFTRFGVGAVPTLVEVNAEGELRKTRGLPGFKWMALQEPGDLGQTGRLFEIAEPDLIEELQRRMAEFDWDAEKNRAIQNYWRNQTAFVDLPAADHPSVKRMDLSIVAGQDIVHPDGRLIVKKGQQLNPQKIMPMRHAYIMFDGTDRAQIDRAKQLGDALLHAKQPVVYLFSKLDREAGWNGFNALSDQLSAPLYQLSQAVVDRFRITALPALVIGEGEAIVVNQFSAEVKNNDP